jgi:hypothetical protein
MGHWMAITNLRVMDPTPFPFPLVTTEQRHFRVIFLVSMYQIRRFAFANMFGISDL